MVVMVVGEEQTAVGYYSRLVMYRKHMHRPFSLPDRIYMYSVCICRTTVPYSFFFEFDLGEYVRTVCYVRAKESCASTDKKTIRNYLDSRLLW